MYLKRMFGDYMVIPPESERKNHLSEILEFGPFEEEINVD